MTDQAKISIDLSTGAVNVEAPVSALEQIFERLESFLPKVSSLGAAIAKKSEDGDTGEGAAGMEDTGKDGSAKSKKQPRPRQASGKPESYKAVELGLDKTKRAEFKEFYESKSPKTQNDQLLVVIYWLLKNTPREKITTDEIFTGLRTVGEKIPKRISSVLTNLGLISYITKEGHDTKLLHIGEDYVDRELPKKSNK